MEVDRAYLHKIAHLARIAIKEQEEDELLASLSETLTWVQTPEEVDTSGIDPLTTMSKEVNMLREDTAKQAISKTAALSNAPASDGDYFKVPNVMESTV